MSKSTGSYYTPHKLSDFMWRYVLKHIQQRPQTRVLEPSCGDGIFLEVASKIQNNKTFLFDAVETNLEAIENAKEVALQQNEQLQINFINIDFLTAELSSQYDLVIGNPPYIGRNLLSKEQRELCKQIQTQAGLDGKDIRNIWPAFVIKAAISLGSTGMMALVLPGELLQVSYAKKIRSFLLEHFSLIEILTFQELIFPALGQDVVVLFAHKVSPVSGISHAQVNNIDSLDSQVKFSRRVSTSLNSGIKWSNFILTDNEIEFLSTIVEKVQKVSDYCTSTPGIVTAANNFFIVNEETVAEYGLKHYCEPIIQKSEFVNKALCIDKEHFEKLKQAGKPCYLLNLKDVEEKTLPLQIQNYLQKGKVERIPERYKCSRRTPWYNIPSVWSPQGVIFKRSHLYPKLLKNEAQLLFTDSAYRILLHEGFNINSFIYSFYNSLTLIFCELNGRFYGGGVLELTPSEFQGLPLPYKSITDECFHNFQIAFENNESIEQVLQQNDALILADLGLDQLDLERLRQIRQKLIRRRLKDKYMNIDEASKPLIDILG